MPWKKWDTSGRKGMAETPHLGDVCLDMVLKAMEMSEWVWEFRKIKWYNSISALTFSGSFKGRRGGKWYRVFSKPVCEAYLLILFLRTTSKEKKERCVVEIGGGGVLIFICLLWQKPLSHSLFSLPYSLFHLEFNEFNWIRWTLSKLSFHKVGFTKFNKIRWKQMMKL